MSDDQPTQSELEDTLYERLERRYGSLLCGDHLRKALGYVSTGAFSRAVYRGTIPVPIFRVHNRRGTCALTLDVARWLAKAQTESLLSRKEATDGISKMSRAK